MSDPGLESGWGSESGSGRGTGLKSVSGGGSDEPGCEVEFGTRA